MRRQFRAKDEDSRAVTTLGRAGATRSQPRSALIGPVSARSDGFDADIRPLVRTIRNQHGERTFDAFGGNGSWDQNGFSAGDAHYPILADLRPLSELLNPINFPDQPEIYIELRQQLDQAIGEYLIARATLSDASLIPDTPVLAAPRPRLAASRSRPGREAGNRSG